MLKKAVWAILNLIIMITIFTAEELFPLAFEGEESYNATVITESDIIEAENRYLVPIVGDTLYSMLCRNSYTELKNSHILPMVAAWVRYIVEPHLASRCCIYHSDRNITEAENENSERVMRALRLKAATLSRKLTNHLNLNSALYAEYNPENNPLTHCFIYGNIVQIC